MRVLVLITSRQKNLNPDDLSARIPEAVAKSGTIEIFAAAHPQGAGANQKVGFRYALDKGFDAVAVFPDNALKALAELPAMIRVLADNNGIDGILGAPKLGPLTGFLSFIQNCAAGTCLSGWHSGVRLYRARLLKEIAFELNASDDVFNAEVLLQMLYHHHAVKVFPLRQWSTCPVSIWGSFKAALKFRLQKYQLFYDVRYHPETLSDTASAHSSVYHEKPDSISPYTIVANDKTLLARGTNVLDVGCASGYMGQWLKDSKDCRVTGIDLLPKERVRGGLEAYHQLNVETDRERFLTLVRDGQFDAVLALDIVEHMSNPELFLWSLCKAAAGKPFKLIVSTGNVAFFSVRLMLFLGHFNYGQKGILDITHKRLFSYHTFKNLLEQTGFSVEAERYCPLPFTELGLPKGLAKFLEGINLFLIRLRPRLFSYQVMFAATPLVSSHAALVRIRP
jgi:2-polyprenyl-3-methyl-5-hydroxy-6-metoxy-1,4-benzoquinol methylase